MKVVKLDYQCSNLSTLTEKYVTSISHSNATFKTSRSLISSLKILQHPAYWHQIHNADVIEK